MYCSNIVLGHVFAYDCVIVLPPKAPVAYLMHIQLKIKGNK